MPMSQECLVEDNPAQASAEPPDQSQPMTECPASTPGDDEQLVTPSQMERWAKRVEKPRPELRSMWNPQQAEELKAAYEAMAEQAPEFSDVCSHCSGTGWEP